MASLRHNFIVSAIVRKMRENRYNIAFLEGRWQDVGTYQYNLPPKIISHRPDVIGENKFGFCIGEAKTEDDIFSNRTFKQFKDYTTALNLVGNNKLIIGIPLSAKESLQQLLHKLGIKDDPRIEVIYIPTEVLPNEEEI